MMIRVILKSGSEFTTKCDKFTIDQNGFGQMTGYGIGGVTENKPIYLDCEQIAAIVRVFSNEKTGEAPEAGEKTGEAPEAGKNMSFTGTKCPFCEGENENARIFEDRKNKEYFVYCPVCGIETTDVFSSKAKAVKAFLEGKTKSITEKE